LDRLKTCDCEDCQAIGRSGGTGDLDLIPSGFGNCAWHGVISFLLPLRQHRGNVTPQDRFEFRQQFDQARIAAGILDWPDNALRHSFASYHMAHFKNAASTALELGHRDSRVTFAHYRELVKPKDAERYWDIKPATTGKKIVQLVTAQR
jgi:hypothetical protein